MSFKLKAIVFLVLVSCFYNVWCKKIGSTGRIARGHMSSSYRQEEKMDLQNAPVSTVYDVGKGSAPIALEGRYQTQNKEAINRQTSQSSNSPNPQKPTGWNGMNDQTTKNWKIDSSRFNHPHYQTNKNTPEYAYPNVGSYDYYGIEKYNYGNGNNEQPFKGYHVTSNIGVIPPKNANTWNYYNNLTGLENNPLVTQHGYRYGTGRSGFGNNAYQNVLAGLLIWNIMNGFKSPYVVYNLQNRPENIPKVIFLSVDAINTCPGNANLFCQENTTTLCYNDTILCASRCDTCARCENASCDENDCITNVTIRGISSTTDIEIDGLSESDGGKRDVSLCVKTMVLQRAEDLKKSCNSTVGCENTTQNDVKGIETTTLK